MTIPILPTTPCLWEKSVPSISSKMLKTHSPSFIKSRGERGTQFKHFRKKIHFLASNFLIFLSNRFAMPMPHTFCKQWKSGDSTERCLWLWVNFHLKGCWVLVVVSNMKKVFNFIISCISLHFTLKYLFYLHKKSDKKKSYVNNLNTYNAIEVM